MANKEDADRWAQALLSGRPEDAAAFYGNELGWPWFTDAVQAMLNEEWERLNEMHPVNRTPTRPSRLEEAKASAEKLRRKLERVEQYAATLETIPEQDPWHDGTVLGVYSGTGHQYILFRVASHWYATGDTRLGAPHKLAWPALVDWFVKTGVRKALEYCQSYEVGLDGNVIESPEDSETLPEGTTRSPSGRVVPSITFPVVTCRYTHEEDHTPHSWTALNKPAWCPGR